MEYKKNGFLRQWNNAHNIWHGALMIMEGMCPDSFQRFRTSTILCCTRCSNCSNNSQQLLVFYQFGLLILFLLCFLRLHGIPFLN